MRSMNWMAVALMCGLAAPAAKGSALITQGSNEISVGGALDFATELGTKFDLNLKYAYFFWDRIAIGARTTMANNNAMNHIGFGLTGEYNFALPSAFQPIIGTDLVPFVGVSADYRYAKLWDEKENTMVFGAETGVKFFLTDSAAISVSLVGAWATEEIYADELDATDKDLSLQLGMRFYF